MAPLFSFLLLTFFFQVPVSLSQAIVQNSTSNAPQNPAEVRPPGRTAGKVACISAQRVLGSNIVQNRGSAEFTAILDNTWNLDNARIQPECIVFPLKTGDVQKAMKAIFDAGSRYAVQAGGHSAMKGWNSVKDGVVISFSRMKNVSYDPIQDAIIMQPGIRWGEAVSQLQAEGVAPIGGRVQDVGTGLLLGGGLSFLSPSHGFAADSILAADVVLVDGKMVTATATNKYADLFRALKGGGNRFGIVTRYVVEAIKTGTSNDKFWFGGNVFYPSSSFEALTRAASDYIRDVTDPNAVLLISFVASTAPLLPTFPPGLSKAGIVSMFYRSPTNSTPTSLPEHIFGQFLSIPHTFQQLGPLSYLEVSSVLGDASTNSPRGFIQHYGASALAPSQDLFLDALAHWTNFTDTFMTSTESQLNMATFAITPVLQNQIDYGRKRGGNAVSPPDGPYAAIQLAEQFTGEVDVPRNVLDAIQLLFHQIPPSEGKPLFLNECDAKQDVYASYGNGKGKEFLKQVNKKYDPTRFNVLHADGPIGL